jgi:hypothetical protein
LLSPHADNEEAAYYLCIGIAQNYGTIEWVVVRPDSLIDELEWMGTMPAIYNTTRRSFLV